MSEVVGADTDLDILCGQVEALRQLIADQQKRRDEDRIYSFSIRWGAFIFGRLERLAHYNARGALSGDVQRRYDALLADLRELAPQMDELGVARPNVL